MISGGSRSGALGELDPLRRKSIVVVVFVVVFVFVFVSFGSHTLRSLSLTAHFDGTLSLSLSRPISMGHSLSLSLTAYGPVREANS